ncbi:ABC transporter permease [Allokutzneria multivorans]|uniref:ABC transporter permease n=1 Tax=Allokutzneria multivorans TaxID=1142134 RepID=A0ABP7SLY5_9PSEU
MAGPEGVIHDIGYQRYQGHRLGRRYAMWSLYVHSLRTAFGLGRGFKAKVLPWTLTAASGIAGLVIMIVSTQTGLQLVGYVDLVGNLTYVAIILLAVVAPELVSRDIGNSVMPLYLARPLSSADYALSKLAALISSVALALGPAMVIMFAGNAFSTKTGMTGVLDHAGQFGQGMAAVAIHSVVLAALALPLASLSGRRIFASTLVLALFLITAPIAEGLAELSRTPELPGMISPTNLVQGVDNWLLGGANHAVGVWGPMHGVVTLFVTCAAVGLLLLRYRKVSV